MPTLFLSMFVSDSLAQLGKGHKFIEKDQAFYLTQESKAKMANTADKETQEKIAEAERLYNLGRESDSKKNYAQSITHYSAAIKINPNFYKSYTNRGNAYSELGKKDLALNDCNQAINLNPKYIAAYNNRGLIYKAQGKFDLALNDFNQIIKLSSNTLVGYYNRGLTYKKQGNKQKAISDFKKVIKLTLTTLMLMLS